jgi:hypothetical protein
VTLLLLLTEMDCDALCDTDMVTLLLLLTEMDCEVDTDLLVETLTLVVTDADLDSDWDIDAVWVLVKVSDWVPEKVGDVVKVRVLDGVRVPVGGGVTVGVTDRDAVKVLVCDVCVGVGSSDWVAVIETVRVLEAVLVGGTVRVGEDAIESDKLAVLDTVDVGNVSDLDREIGFVVVPAPAATTSVTETATRTSSSVGAGVSEVPFMGGVRVAGEE